MYHEFAGSDQKQHEQYPTKNSPRKITVSSSFGSVIPTSPSNHVYHNLELGGKGLQNAGDGDAQYIISNTVESTPEYANQSFGTVSQLQTEVRDGLYLCVSPQTNALHFHHITLHYITFPSINAAIMG